MSRANDTIAKARVSAQDRESRKAQIVKDAAHTPQGRALIDLIMDQFGYVEPSDSTLKSYRALGSFDVTQWLYKMENLDRIERIDDD